MATTRVMRSEQFPDLNDEVLFPRLSDSKLAWFAKQGEKRVFEPGEVLYEHAVRDAPFYVIEEGTEMPATNRTLKISLHDLSQDSLRMQATK